VSRRASRRATSRTRRRLITFALPIVVVSLATSALVACGGRVLTNDGQERAVVMRESPELKQALRALESQFVAQSVREERHYFRRSEELEAFWRRFDPSSSPPNVDFSRDDVVIVLMGTQGSSGFSVRLTSAERNDRDLSVSFVLCRPNQDQAQLTVLTSPFDARLLEKWDGSVSYRVSNGRTGRDDCR
jgi:hypothetical protein